MGRPQLQLAREPLCSQTPVSNHPLTISTWKAHRNLTSYIPYLNSGSSLPIPSPSSFLLCCCPPCSSQKLAGPGDSLLFLTIYACISPSLPTPLFDPPCFPCGRLGSYACAVPLAWNLSHHCSSITFPWEALLTPPLYIPSQPCIPPCVGLITLRVYLHGYLTHVSLHQVANSIRIGTKSVLFTDNPQCLARSTTCVFKKNK